MRLDAKKFFFALFFFIATLAGVAFYHFDREQKQTDQNINNTLEKAASAADIIVGSDYQERVLNIPPDDIQDAETINTLTTLAHVLKVEHIYTAVYDANGTLRLTSTSAYQSTGVHGIKRYFEVLPNNPEIAKALNSNRILWHTHQEDKKFRSIYVPHSTPSGYRYVVAADMEITSIQRLSNAAGFKAVAISLIIFIGALPFLLIYRNTLQGTADFLREKVMYATDELREVNEILETKVEEKTKQLISQSFEDSLTKLPNRHRLQYDMDRKEYNALIIINIHNFREINDFFGIQAGDSLLRQMGHWLLQVDFHPYRLSGDEFAILLDEEYTRSELEELISRLFNRLADHPFKVDEESVSLSVTIGVDTAPGITLSRADIALHQAKENSKHYAFYDSTQNIEERYKSNIAITKDIHDALNAGRIICYYQPIVSIKSGRIEKYETLVRMIDEKAQIIPPLDFLTIAQKTRLYPQITQTVIEHACYTFRNRDEEFSVNLSIRDILDSHTVRFIEEMIVQTDTAHRIVFEILESEGIENFDAVSRFIRRMKKLGAKIAIDDFGTGYSSIENILKLEVDYIKIDGSLIRNINNDPKHAIVVESINDFVTKLGAKTIAEFVNSEEIYTKIKSIGIDYAQGYHVGKPAALGI